MAKKKRTSVHEREREHEKRRRELKKAEKATQKRERRFTREGPSFSPGAEDPDVEPDLARGDGGSETD